MRKTFWLQWSIARFFLCKFWASCWVIHESEILYFCIFRRERLKYWSLFVGCFWAYLLTWLHPLFHKGMISMYSVEKLQRLVYYTSRKLNDGDMSVERCRELLRTLQVMLSWLRTTRQRMRHQQSLGGDLISLQRQCDELAVICGRAVSFIMQST